MQSPWRRAAVRTALALFASVAATAGRSAEVAEPAVPRHHRAGGYQNNYLEFSPPGVAALLRWRFDALREGLPKPALNPTPVQAPDLAFIHANAHAGMAMQPAVTWIGHATTLAQLGGLNVLTDPIFSARASPLGFIGPKRRVAPGMSLAQLPHIDVVVISHNHYDHLDDDSVRALARQPGGAPLFLVPLGLKAWLARRDIVDAIELDWWQSHRVGAVEFMLTPVQHWSGRGLDDRLATLWGGWAMLAPDAHVFFAGDTAYSKDFADIRRHVAARQGVEAGGGFDAALIPIGAYEPRWFMRPQHVNPDEAVQIHLDLGAKRSIGVHWGTFVLTDESLDQPPIDLAAARRAHGLADEAFSVLAVGETRRLPPRSPRVDSTARR